MYVPTNHIYVGDIFLLGKEDVIHTNLSVREGLGTLLLPETLLPLKQIHYHVVICHLVLPCLVPSLQCCRNPDSL